jgi:hypothetical protein
MATATIIYDMPDATYRADPCEKPSLTQSHVKLLLERSPAHVWHNHPRLNPDYQPDDDTKFDIGNVTHKLLLGRGKKVVALPFDNWTTKAAKEARERHRADGCLAVLQEQFDRASAMADAARTQLKLSEFPEAFIEGHAEVVITWTEGRLHFRAMLDWVVNTGLVIDYKSTKLSCAPHAVAERPSLLGWDIQASFHERALDAVDPEGAGRRKHVFVTQEDTPPYALSVVRIGEADMTLGRKKIAAAIETWSLCTATNNWPRYPVGTIVSQPVPWREKQWLDRELAADACPTNLLMAG